MPKRIVVFVCTILSPDSGVEPALRGSFPSVADVAEDVLRPLGVVTSRLVQSKKPQRGATLTIHASVAYEAHQLMKNAGAFRDEAARCRERLTQEIRRRVLIGVTFFDASIGVEIMWR